MIIFKKLKIKNIYGTKYNDRSEVMILNILCFITGTMFGIALMCIVQINRKNNDK